jgi:hypothetical protein
MSGAVVVAGSHRLYAVSSRGDVVLARPWHLVDTGTWDHDTSTLRVSWVDGERAAQWRLPEPALLPETVRERVQASVVLAERVALGGGGQARAVIRQDFGTGRLVEQVVLGRGVAARDPAVTLATEAALARLREQVGMD